MWEFTMLDNKALHVKSLAPEKCVSNFTSVLFNELIFCVLSVKLVSGEGQRTPLMNSQHWFRLPVFKIRSETCRTETQFCRNLFMVKKESLPDWPKFWRSGSAVCHLFWRLGCPTAPSHYLTHIDPDVCHHMAGNNITNQITSLAQSQFPLAQMEQLRPDSCNIRGQQV